MADEGSNKSNILLIILLVINMGVGLAFGIYLFRAHKIDEQAQKAKLMALEKTVSKEVEKSPEKKMESPVEDSSYTRKVVRFETLITNLANEDGRHIVRLSLEAKLQLDSNLEEFQVLKPKLRDAIILVVGGFTAEDLATNDGKEELKAHLREALNSVLKKGKIDDIYITELEMN